MKKKSIVGQILKIVTSFAGGDKPYKDKLKEKKATYDKATGVNKKRNS